MRLKITGETALIEDIGVLEAFRGKGIAKTMTDLDEKVAIEKGAKRIGALAQPDYLNLLQEKGYSIDAFIATKDLPITETS